MIRKLAPTQYLELPIASSMEAEIRMKHVLDTDELCLAEFGFGELETRSFLK